MQAPERQGKEGTGQGREALGKGQAMQSWEVRTAQGPGKRTRKGKRTGPKYTSRRWSGVAPPATPQAPANRDLSCCCGSTLAPPAVAFFPPPPGGLTPGCLKPASGVVVTVAVVRDRPLLETHSLPPLVLVPVLVPPDDPRRGRTGLASR